MRLLVLLVSVFFSLQAFSPSAVRGSVTQSQAEAFVSGSIVVEGFGLPPLDDTLVEAQKRALGLRAARVMALRAAVEAIDGVAVSGATVVRDATVLSEEVKVSVKSFIRGATVLSEEYDEETGIATVTLSVSLTGSTGIAAALIPDVGRLQPALPFYNPGGKYTPGAGYDGLVVDVRGTSFRPAILNRVVTADARVLFDPSMVKAGPMEKATTVGYTDSLAHAVEMLYELGSKKPVTITPTGLSGPTDVVVSGADSLMLFGANAATGLLKRGRVVFVLGGR